MSKIDIAKHISIRDAIDIAVKDIEDAASGLKERTLKTNIQAINNALGGGLPWQMLTVIAAPSGAGKTTLLNYMDFDFFDRNPKQSLMYLFFSLEISPTMLLAKKASAFLKKPIDEVLSFDKNKLSSSSIKELKEHLSTFANRSIYYFTEPLTVRKLKNTVIEFAKANPTKGVVYSLDHSLLLDGEDNENENQTMASTSKALIEIKNYNTLGIILGQLNTQIETTNRIMNPNNHYPLKSDIHGGKSLYHASDNLIILNRPEILGIEEYGPQAYPTANTIFGHVIKSRYNELCMFTLGTEGLKYSIINERKAPARR